MRNVVSVAVTAACISLLAAACSAPPRRSPQSSPPTFESAARQHNQQIQERANRSPPFDAAKWSQLTVGMSAQAVLDLLGPPIGARFLGSAGLLHSTWLYVFDAGAREMLVHFGQPLPPGPATDVRVTVDPRTFRAADEPLTVFDWSGK